MIDEKALGYPLESLRLVPPGKYRVQALLHKYETFHRADGHVVKLPDGSRRGAALEPGARQPLQHAQGDHHRAGPSGAASATIAVTLDKVIPPIPDAARRPSTSSTRRSRASGSRSSGAGPCTSAPTSCCPRASTSIPRRAIRSSSSTATSPRPSAASARSRPTRISSPSTASGSTCQGYNRIEQELAHQFYKEWTGPDYPRMIIIEIQHANPYYDDSYAVNSANLGPYGDAITYELIPYLEKKYRCLGTGLVAVPLRRLDRRLGGPRRPGLLPRRVQRLLRRLPRPDRLPRLHGRRHLQGQERVLRRRALAQGPAARDAQLPRAHQRRPWRTSTATSWCSAPRAGRASSGTSGRPCIRPSGPTATPSGSGTSGPASSTTRSPKYWREHYDLGHILERDWPKIGKKLEGKIHIYVGDMDNFYLNNAVYLVEDILKKTKDPAYGGEVAYGDRAEHCWNGDPTRPNAISRLRYHQMFAPRIVERLLKTAPPGARRHELAVLNRWRDQATSVINRRGAESDAAFHRGGIDIRVARPVFASGSAAIDSSRRPGLRVPVGVGGGGHHPGLPDPDDRLRESRKTESEGIASRLKARALAIGDDDEAGDGPAVLVAIDNCAVGLEDDRGGRGPAEQARSG